MRRTVAELSKHLLGNKTHNQLFVFDDTNCCCEGILNRNAGPKVYVRFSGVSKREWQIKLSVDYILMGISV